MVNGIGCSIETLMDFMTDEVKFDENFGRDGIPQQCKSCSYYNPEDCSDPESCSEYQNLTEQRGGK